MGEAPRISRLNEAPLHPLHGEGVIRKLIYPDMTGSSALFIGLAVVPPGQAPHVFHRHETEIHGKARIDYSADFEEFYFVVSGSGEMQWLDDVNEQHGQQVDAGDAIYMPRDCLPHRIFNTGSKDLHVLYGGTPPARITAVTDHETGREEWPE